MRLREIVYGKMFVMTMWAFHVFIKIVSSMCNLHVKVHVSPETSILIFFVEAMYLSLEDRYVRRLFV